MNVMFDGYAKRASIMAGDIIMNVDNINIEIVS